MSAEAINEAMKRGHYEDVRDRAVVALDIVKHVNDRVDGVDETGALKITEMKPEDKALRAQAIEYLKAYLQKIM